MKSNDATFYHENCLIEVKLYRLVYICLHVYLCVRIIYVYICMNVLRVCVFICNYTCECVKIHAYGCVHSYMCLYVCLNVYM